MAERRPLVNVSGQLRELPTGDTLPADAGKVSNASGQTNTLWTGTQAAFDALDSSVKNAAGSVFVIRA